MGSLPVPMDMRLGSHCYFHAERMFYQSFTAQWARKYDLPVFGTGGVSDSYGADYQLGAETAVSLYGSVLTGQNLIHDLAIIGSGYRNSFEVLTLLDEMVGMVRRVTENFEVNDDTLAIDVIEEVGHGETFLSKAHTREHGRKELFMPDLMKKREQANWDFNVAMEDAHEQVQDLVEGADPKPLPEGVDEELQSIMDEAEQLGKELDKL